LRQTLQALVQIAVCPSKNLEYLCYAHGHYRPTLAPLQYVLPTANIRPEGCSTAK
jgi:hypothetical protein